MSKKTEIAIASANPSDEPRLGSVAVGAEAGSVVDSFAVQADPSAYAAFLKGRIALPAREQPSLPSPSPAPVAALQGDGSSAPAAADLVAAKMHTALSPAYAGSSALVEGNDAPRWASVADLPSYLSKAVQNLGQHIFSSFPCFEKGDRGIDSIRVMAKLQGADLGGRQIEEVAAWISQNGTGIAASALAFPEIFPGYSPRVGLALSDNDTFLMVMDERQRGAPVDAVYIYSWPGGMRHYQAHPTDAPRLQAVFEATAAPRIAPPPPPAQRRRIAPPRPAVTLPAKIDSPVRQRDKSRLGTLPAARHGETLATQARRDGFDLDRTTGSPRLVRQSDEGLQVLTSDDGAALMKAEALFATLVRGDTSGPPRRVTSMDEIQQAFSCQPPLPRP